MKFAEPVKETFFYFLWALVHILKNVPCLSVSKTIVSKQAFVNFSLAAQFQSASGVVVPQASSIETANVWMSSFLKLIFAFIKFPILRGTRMQTSFEIISELKFNFENFRQKQM